VAFESWQSKGWSVENIVHFSSLHQHHLHFCPNNHLTTPVLNDQSYERSNSLFSRQSRSSSLLASWLQWQWCLPANNLELLRLRQRRFSLRTRFYSVPTSFVGRQSGPWCVPPPQQISPLDRVRHHRFPPNHEHRRTRWSIILPRQKPLYSPEVGSKLQCKKQSTEHVALPLAAACTFLNCTPQETPATRRNSFLRARLFVFI
jgi:hypothetical protein